MVWIVVRWVLVRCVSGPTTVAARRDLCVGLALAAMWLAIWALYSAYTWTTDPTSVTVQVVRFYLPPLGPIAILGAWLATRIPGREWLTGLVTVAAITLLFTQGTQAFHTMYAAFGVPLND